MANNCFTDYIIEGDRKELQSLYKALKRIDTKAELKKTSGFGGRWLGNLVTELGGDWQKVYCRGTIEWYEMEDDQLKLTTDTAWVPMNEVFDFICEKFPGLSYYYQAEEPGCDLFWTNDSAGIHFCRYLVRICKDGYDDEEYFDDLKKVYKYISDNFKVKITSLDDIRTLQEELEDKETEDYCYLNEFVNPN